MPLAVKNQLSMVTTHELHRAHLIPSNIAQSYSNYINQPSKECAKVIKAVP